MIVTDNSAVIAALNERIAKLEQTLSDTAEMWGGKFQELEKERDELKEANTEAKEYIESELGPIFHSNWPHETYNPKLEQTKRDLEQQSKGAIDAWYFADMLFERRGLDSSNGNAFEVFNMVNSYSGKKKAEAKAKALKEQGSD